MRLLQWGAPLSLIALVRPAPPAGNGLFGYLLAHLVVIQVATLALVIEMAPESDRPWFGHNRRPSLATAASLVAVAVGFSALLALATSAAARYDVSLQFLQLLSSLDIAWVVGALYLGVRLLRGRALATVAGSFLLAACVASIGVYLREVGFGPGGSWLVDGEAMLRIVISADVAAAVLSTGALLWGVRRLDQPTAQPRPQSYS